MPLTPGTRLGSYEVVSLLGAGGMGEVYVAEDKKLSRKVALKVLPPEMATGERRKRFEREAKAVAALNHPNIVTIHTVEEAEGFNFITMELVQGKTLTELIPTHGLALNKFLEMAITMADAVSAAHQQGITHRDLKPDNITLSDEGRLKILDFGLAKLRQEFVGSPISELPTRTRTGEGRLLGTVAYMSPEQAEGKSVDHRSDIFSIGICLYQMATGQRPFRGDSTASILSSILRDTPTSVTELRPDLPRDLGKVIKRCLVKDPEHRYQTAKDVRNELQELKQDVESGEVMEGVPTRSTDSLWDVLVSGDKRQKSKLAVIVLGTLVLLISIAVALSVVFLRPSSRPSPTQPTHRQLTFTGDAAYPAISPDGNFAAYVTGGADQEQQVMVQDLTGGKPLEIFRGKDIAFLRWSPDGSELLLAVTANDKHETVIVPRLGGAARRFQFLNHLTWSSDGSRFAGTKYARKYIEVIEKSTGNTQQISLSGSFTWLYDVGWSPAGNLLLFLTTDDQGRSAIWTIAPDGTQQRKLIEHEGELAITSPRWSPTGDAIYYLHALRIASSRHRGSGTVGSRLLAGFIRTVDRSTARHLIGTTGISSRCYPAPSPSRRRIGLWRRYERVQLQLERSPPLVLVDTAIEALASTNAPEVEPATRLL